MKNTLIVPQKLPRHVAIIMDGNGRWAKAHRLGRIAGHRAGVKSIRMVVKTAREVGVKFLTLFAFSTENKKRPKREVEALFALLKQFLIKERKELIKNNVRLKVIGDIEWFPESVQKEIKKTVDATERGSAGVHIAGVHGLTLILALNYGGRQDIVQACQRITKDIQRLEITPSEIDEKAFASYLYTKDLPDPDLLIRTSNEYRISNFLLWQLSYAEIWITPVLWPDFSKSVFLEALISYQNRKRRFGMVKNA
ncbi:MAG: isoprenyl transferase [Candidatus Omnitrophica bacterium]|nr:isoprenyl transferase [Candidatus Omnitrophota bacterium]